MNESNYNTKLPELRSAGRGLTSAFVVLCLFFVVSTVQLSAAIKSTSGNIHFNSDYQNNNNNEMTLSSEGFGIGTTTPTANLHVSGNTIVSNNLSIGSSSSATSTLFITGTLGYSVQMVSDNVTLSGNSYVLANTSTGNITITLPSASSVAGRQYTIKKITASNNVTLSGNIDSSLTQIMYSGNTDSMNIISNDSQWWILSKSF